MEYPLKLKSIKRKTLSDMVVDEIITLLTTGKLKPGDKLPSELELVEMLNVSRSVLREALISLETLGVIERRTKEGTFICHKIGTRPYHLMLLLQRI
ncbi:FadR/GntR family transcriptional regulator [Caldifermentibacillus hisashii]|uniref:FadR/GntR family transcriptional regulator n=1 Tax=Caldifermentibacillus hisashii TaxID=996558 RepID=UPI0022B952DD|nr:GntR family transcriptional regulator [Caldifermentibacillus hisashii]